MNALMQITIILKPLIMMNLLYKKYWMKMILYVLPHNGVNPFICNIRKTMILKIWIVQLTLFVKSFLISMKMQ